MKLLPLLLPSKTRLYEYTHVCPPKSARSWGRYVTTLYSGQCLITGLGAKDIPLQKHHLYARKLYPTLELCALNGVLLAEELHLDFHGKMGFDVTPDHLIRYIDSLKEGYLKPLTPRLNQATDWLRFVNQELIKELEKHENVKENLHPSILNR